jgi:ribosome-associated protein YbcJ (S4-like RNA binding protein)
MKNKQLILDKEVKCGGEAIKRKNIKEASKFAGLF